MTFPNPPPRLVPFHSSAAHATMSVIHLHLGQAGNQIGKSFWGLAEDEFFVDDGGGGGSGPKRARESTKPLRPSMRPGGTAMFHEDGSARCLAVDSEPKASVLNTYKPCAGVTQWPQIP